MRRVVSRPRARPPRRHVACPLWTAVCPAIFFAQPVARNTPHTTVIAISPYDRYPPSSASLCSAASGPLTPGGKQQAVAGSSVRRGSDAACPGHTQAEGNAFVTRVSAASATEAGAVSGLRHTSRGTSFYRSWPRQVRFGNDLDGRAIAGAAATQLHSRPNRRRGGWRARWPPKSSRPLLWARKRNPVRTVSPTPWRQAAWRRQASPTSPGYGCCRGQC